MRIMPSEEKGVFSWNADGRTVGFFIKKEETEMEPNQESKVQTKKPFPMRKFVESALMVAIATVLSLIKIDLPFGGGLTICSMLPIVLISHRHGVKWGLATAFVYSLIQLVLGLDNVGYAESTLMAVGIILLDYVLAYTVLGLSGGFNKIFRDGSKPTAVMVGVAFTFILRFLCHFVTGAWIWGVWMPEEFMNMPMTNPWVYSALYNGWYMLAELVLTEIVVVLLYLPLGKYFRGEDMK